MKDDAPPTFISGPDLDPYRNAVSGVCWWCGGSANSREHKFKRTDLDRMSDGSGLLRGSTASPNLIPILSTRKSKVVKFEQNLCRKCNDTRSQAFDLAYDKYANYVWANHARLLRRSAIDMKNVYGESVVDDLLDLGRYFTKHIGCRMANDGYSPPSELAEFLDGGLLLSNVQMVLFRDLSGLRWWNRAPRAGEQEPGLSMGDAYGEVDSTRSVLTTFSSVTMIGRIGVFYRWQEDWPETDPFYLYRRAQLHKRASLPLY